MRFKYEQAQVSTISTHIQITGLPHSHSHTTRKWKGIELKGNIKRKWKDERDSELARKPFSREFEVWTAWAEYHSLFTADGSESSFSLVLIVQLTVRDNQPEPLGMTYVLRTELTPTTRTLLLRRQLALIKFVCDGRKLTGNFALVLHLLLSIWIHI